MSARVAVVVAAALVAGCGDGSSQTQAGGEPRLVSEELVCAAGTTPVAAAYDAGSGELLWTSCSSATGYVWLEGVADGVVHVGTGGQPLGFAAAGGKPVQAPPPMPDDAARVQESPPVVQGVRLIGGQDDPLVASDASTGEELWRSDLHLPYDDVWAVGDGGVFLLDVVPTSTGPSTGEVVGLEVRSGDERWRTPVGSAVYPYWVDGERVVAIWNDITVLDVDDGSVVWTTAFGERTFPRYTGAVIVDDRLYVSVANAWSQGD